MTIGLVDDDAIVRSWVRQSLAGSEFRVAGEATTAGEVSDLLARRNPSVLLVDYRLPDLPATDLVRSLRAQGVQARVLVMTAAPAAGLNEAVLEAGAQGVLRKRGDRDELLAALRAVAAGKRHLDPEHPKRSPGQAGLSVRERQVLRLAARGATNPEISRTLGIGTESVKTLLSRVFVKLGARNRVEAVDRAREQGPALRPSNLSTLRDTFARDAGRRADAIERALAEVAGERRDAALESLAAEAHGVRGAAASVQLAGLEALAAALEYEVERENDGIRDRVERIAAAGRRLSEALRAQRAAAGDDPENEGRPAASGSGPTILHIEDNTSNLRLVELVLGRRPGLTLVEARDGETGLALARDLEPALILLDLRLPDIAGDDVLRHLRADARTSRIPVVLVSAEARPQESDRLLAAGAVAYLVKPVDVEMLLEVVDGVIARCGP